MRHVVQILYFKPVHLISIQLSESRLVLSHGTGGDIPAHMSLHKYILSLPGLNVSEPSGQHVKWEKLSFGAVPVKL